jgi:hypothetical protein
MPNCFCIYIYIRPDLLQKEEEYSNKWAVSGHEIAEIYCRGTELQNLGKRKLGEGGGILV